MSQTTLEIATGRAHTDASLDAERVNADIESLTSAAALRDELDDQIARHRIHADSRLLKFRVAADNTLLDQRSKSADPGPTIADERSSADVCQAQERQMADAALDAERQRSDIAVETERTTQAAYRHDLETLRQETDDQLSSERQGADTIADALSESKRALADAHREQERRHDVLAIVSHDLRSPLTVISMNAETISAGATNDIQKCAHAITRSVARIERLIADLLDIARIETGTLHIVRRRHDIVALLNDLHAEYEPMFARGGVGLAVSILSERLVAYFDHDRIVQVLSNLLGNAMKFTASGGRVTVEAVDAAGSVIFAVSDTGEGIPADALPHVFERFWQGHPDTRRGLGLGLHICQKIVEAHGGQIWAESQIGRGSIFRFSLPVR